MTLNKSNSVRLLPVIANDSSYIKLYTDVDNGIEVGDKVYICSYDKGAVNSDLDNYQYYIANSSLTADVYYIDYEKYLQGYNVLSVDTKNNGITIDRPYSTVKNPTVGLNNFFISKLYIKNSHIYSASVNGVLLEYAQLTDQESNQISWVQGVMLGGSVSNLVIGDKYPSDVISTNASVSNGSVISNYTNNNGGNGYSVFSGITSSISLAGVEVYNGVFCNCTISGEASNNITKYPTIHSGYFQQCDITNNYRILDGYFLNTHIRSIDSIWHYGTYDRTDVTVVFSPLVWNDGIWKSGNIPNNVQWLNGHFYGNTFNDTCDWANGTFKGVLFDGNTWLSGIFNGGTFNSGKIWTTGTFNDGNFLGVWQSGVFNNGKFTGTNWLTGIFNNGDFFGTNWETGTFNNGTFNKTSIWKGGIFNGGTFNGIRWENGKFYNGIFSESQWLNGDFYNGDMINSNWNIGNFYYGRMFSNSCTGGTFHNGISNYTNFYNVQWRNGIFNDGKFGIVGGAWLDGSFNTGEFGANAYFFGGVFYDGIFRGYWQGGVFYNGNYDGANLEPRFPKNRPFVPYQKEKITRKLNKRLIPNYILGIKKSYK